jgi:predicted alpha/beta superfamily hydrolase
MKIAFRLFVLVLLFANISTLVAQVSVGKIQRIENFGSQFVDPRNIDVWLPDDYSKKERYAVLYMHDGQMLFDSTTTWNHQEWGIDEIMNKLLKEKIIRNCIVVGIWNNGKYRHPEYFPQKALEYLTKQEKQDLLNYSTGDSKEPILQNGPISDNYLKFIVNELKPYIDQNFFTLTDRTNTFIAGSSMGGLISMYAICEYPDVFGGAACISTHWPGTFKAQNNPVPKAFLAYLADHLPSPENHKFYFDYGTKTLDAMYKTYQMKADEIMKKKGYTNANWITREFPGEDHSERAWRKRIEIPLTFLLK